jgi:hypothetical protein
MLTSPSLNISGKTVIVRAMLSSPAYEIIVSMSQISGSMMRQFENTRPYSPAVRRIVGPRKRSVLNRTSFTFSPESPGLD